jgi:hypothetical protein
MIENRNRLQKKRLNTESVKVNLETKMEVVKKTKENYQMGRNKI